MKASKSLGLRGHLAAGAFCALTLAWTPAPAQNLRENLTVHKLDNGMTILVYPRTQTPVFAAVLSMDVAGSDESYGETGVAHMFEHMAFKGTNIIGTTNPEAEKPLMEEMDRHAEAARAELAMPEPDMAKVEAAREKIRQLQAEQSKYIVKDELDLILSRNGATGVNASTGADFTTYYTALPSNRLEMYFWLEADRMKNPVMREFYSERDVVMEERRQRTDNSAGGLLYEAFTNAAFQAHPYGKPVIGWASEISSVTRPMAEEFRAKFYGPKSAVLAIVGDVDPAEVVRLSEKYFADWDAPGAPKRLVTREPEQRGERRLRVEFDAEPSLMMGWHKPGIPTTDDAAFSWLGQILTSGANSRLYKELVTNKKLVTGIGAYSAPGDKYENMFVISASPRSPHTVEEVEAAIHEVIAKLVAEGVTEKEMERVRRSFERAYIEQASSNMGFADVLAETTNLYKDPYAFETEKQRLLAITAEQIQAVAKKYLRTENQTVAWVERPAADQEVAK